MRQYPVAEHDTLWKIAKRFGVTVQALASANHLKGKQLHWLHIDQLLLIPDDESSSTPDCELKLHFRGLDFSDVTPKRVKLTYDGREEEHELKGNCISLAVQDHACGLKISVENLEKEMEPVWEVPALPIGQWKLNVDSRQVKVDGALQKKAGTPTSSTTAVKEVTTHNAQLAKGKTAQEQTRIESGKPVQGLATIYTEANLRLLPGNEPFRKYLIEAAKNHGLTPQSLAAMINAEARSVKGVWEEKSNHEKAALAQGLGQFFPPAWQDIFSDESSLLHKEGKKWNEKEMLPKRLVARFAIDGAAVYAKRNLKNFAKKTKYDVDGLPPEDKAKIAYLLHHEGLKGGLRLVGIGTPFTPDEARDLLAAQLGDTKAGREQLGGLLARYDKDPIAAYKGWLFGYMDAAVNVNNFVVNDKEKFLKQPRTTAEILSVLASQPLPAPPKPKVIAPVQTNPVAKDAPVAQSKQTASEAASAKSKPPGPGPGTSTAKQSATTAAPAGTITALDNGAKWHDPLDTCTLRTAHLASKVGAKFGWTRQGGHKCHQGIDLVAAPGTTIYAVANGEVYTRKAPDSSYAYGNTLVLEVGIDDLPAAQAEVFRKVNPGVRTIGFFYAHLSEMPEEKKLKVYAGDPIGKSGCSGNANEMTTIALGAHLHFEVRKIARKTCGGLDNRVDPLLFIQNCTNK